MSGRHRPDVAADCRRTPAVRDRIVAGSVSVDDREHATTCASCGPVLARAARFDHELGRAARSLITEELPRDILDPAIDGARGFTGVRSRRSVPGLSAMLGAIAILLAATAVWLAPLSPAPPGSPVPSAKPTRLLGPLFHPVQGIIARINELEYRCNDGHGEPMPSGGAGIRSRESAICVAPESLGFRVGVRVGESAESKIVTVLIEADLHSEFGDNPSDLGNVAMHVSKVAQGAIVGAYESLLANEVILGRFTKLQPGERNVFDDDGLRIEIMRHDSTTFSVRIDAVSPKASTIP